MKIVHAITLASVAAMLAFSGTAWAVEATATTGTTEGSKTGTQDISGMATLGVDISGAGTTSANVKLFLAAMPAADAAKLVAGCETVIANQADRSASVLTFCQAATGKM
jgi:hypothetical protein